MTRSRTAAAAAAAMILASSSVARAEPVVGVEARGELTSLSGDLRGGPGLRLSFGYALDTYPVLVLPEVVADGAPFLPAPVVGAFRGMGGVRVGFTTVVEPFVFTHLGYGFLGTESALVHGFSVDAGLGLDKRLGRHVTMGGSIGYQGFVGLIDAHGGAAGFHVGIWL